MRVCHFQRCQELKQANVNLIKSVKITLVQYQVNPIVLTENANVGEALNVEVLKAVAKACKSNNDCQNVWEDPFNALCVNGVCSCN